MTSIAFGPGGNIFVEDFYNLRVQKFAPDGIFLTSFGSRGSGPGKFEYPVAVSVTDFGNNRVQAWWPR